MSLETVRLANGLTVYNDRIPGAYTNNVTMFVPYGSINEQVGHEGVAHAFEHCVHLQTDQFANRAELRRHAQTSGMVTNANTYYTRTLYYGNGLELEPNINHLSQILQHTHFPEEAVEHEMKAVRREAITNLDDVNRAHAIASYNTMFNLPYGRSVIGYHDNLDFNAETLKQLHDTYYKLGRMALIVTGKAKLDEVVTLADRYFEADATAYSPADQVPAVELRPDHSAGLVREDSANVRLAVMQPMTSEFRDCYLANTLLYNIATVAIRDACFQHLRYEKGISYDGSLAINNHNHPDAWSINGSVTTDADHLPAAKAAFNEIFLRTDEYYHTDAILGALAMYRYSFSSSLLSADSKMDTHTAKLARYQTPQDVRTGLRKLQKISVADVRGAINDLSAFLSHEAGRYTLVTGQRHAIGEVDRIIDPREFS